MNEFGDIFLTRWLNDELSAEELSAFKKSTDYDMYVKIIKGTEKLEGPHYNLEQTFNIIKKKKNQDFNSNIKNQNKINWQLSIAASFILLIGLITYFNLFSKTEYTSDYGEHLAFELPDESKVILNSKSTITFNKYNWNSNRIIELDGEAFFDVEKGNTFIVKTKEGQVSVLGTEFNVSSGNDFFKVTCFEGKVKVTDNTNNSNLILLPSEGYQKTKENTPITLKLNNNKPLWINKQFVFKSTPVKNVFEALEKQFDLKFVYTNFDDSILFSGTFPNNNKEIALKSVLKSLNLKYSVQNKTITLED